jgi:RimJ/RimL family protein N-acetyltransferase
MSKHRQPTTVRLRPFEEPDLVLLERFATDPDFSLPFEWSGFSSRQQLRRRWERHGLLDGKRRYLVIGLPDGTGAGWVSWRDPGLGGRPGWSWEMGIMLAPEHRGRGVGTAAQAELCRYLFSTTSVHRIIAFTEDANLAEQRSLEKSGFVREGVLRRCGFRGGTWRDAVLYARLRDDEVPN